MPPGPYRRGLFVVLGDQKYVVNVFAYESRVDARKTFTVLGVYCIRVVIEEGNVALDGSLVVFTSLIIYQCGYVFRSGGPCDQADAYHANSNEHARFPMALAATSTVAFTICTWRWHLCAIRVCVRIRFCGVVVQNMFVF
jgi:hypothetical protein